MSFNALKEKGMPLEKQLRNWHQIAGKPYNKTDVDCYTRTRQILMNGIEVEAWNFHHTLGRLCPDIEDSKLIAQVCRIEDEQQTTINWMAPADQSVLETTLGYEQVAVDLTAWLAQNEPDDYVKETFDFGLLEDFDAAFDVLKAHCPQSTLVPFNFLDFEVFTQAEKDKAVIINVQHWAEAHPLFKSCAIDWPLTARFGLIFAKHPSASLQLFLDCLPRPQPQA